MGLFIFLLFIFIGLILASWVVHSGHESLCSQDCYQGRRCTCCKNTTIKEIEQKIKYEDECG